LRVSLEDLHSAESKGKWWLVGAAWGGDPLVDKQAEFTKTTGVSASNGETTADEDSNDLVKLARSQGMNTDIRRGIFVVLMSSDVCFFSSLKHLTFDENLRCRITSMLVRGFLS
jgi:nucleolar MIF4G domain-containing protein 1